LTILYCSTDRLRRGGAPAQNLSHSASFHSSDKNAPSKPGIKHLAAKVAVAGLRSTTAHGALPKCLGTPCASGC
jgi:hypothetical protein